MTNRPFVVWAEIPVTDLQKSIEFYNAVFGYDLQINTDGPNPTAMFFGDDGSVGGHLYPAKPAAAGTGSTVHLAVPDTVEAAMKRCIDAGGKVVSDPTAIPPGRFAYALDLDGNSIGLFQPT